MGARLNSAKGLIGSKAGLFFDRLAKLPYIPVLGGRIQFGVK